MKWEQRQRTKTLLISLMFLATLGIFLGWLTRRGGYRDVHTLSRSPAPEISPDTTSTPATNARPSSEMAPAASASAGNTGTQSTPTPTVSPAGLIIPVAGVRSDQLLDTFSAARGEGRVHDAIDIAAPQGTPVLAAAGGKILRLFQSKAGGTTIYQLSSDEKLI